MSKTKLPIFLKKYFWEVNFKRLDPERYPSYIIQRILNFGKDQATKWLFKNFDEEIIKQTLRDRRGFSKRAAAYWSKFFNMPKREIMYFKKGFPNPPVRLWPY